jgi:hypothetical protein
MDVHKLKDLHPDDRLSVLQGEAIKQVEQVYTRFLTEEEMTKYKDEVSQTAIVIAATEEELRQVKADFKDKLDPLRAEFKVALTAVSTRGIQETGMCYLLPDYDTQMIHVVTKAGDVLNSRRMLPEEKQFNISHQLNKAI